MAEWSTHKSSPSGDVFSVINQTFASSTGHGTVSRKKKNILKCVMKTKEKKYLCSGLVSQSWILAGGLRVWWV